jgi:3-oxoacyl-[acyl-carrier protein] reductase
LQPRRAKPLASGQLAARAASDPGSFASLPGLENRKDDAVAEGQAPREARPALAGVAEKALSGEVAAVTGGARGIGLAIAETLAGRGAAVAIWDVMGDAAGEAAKKIEGAGGKTFARAVDVTKPEDVESAVAETARALGKIGILVNNAGITRDNLLLRMDEAEWDQVLSVNLKGAFVCTKAVSRLMRKTGGAIVNIASVVGMIGNPGQANYSASKAGLIGLTKTCARELARYNIRVNAVAPGFIDTAMTRQLGEDARERILANVPVGRFGTPEDVAAAVVFLVGPDSSYVTGQVLRVCGGMVM